MEFRPEIDRVCREHGLLSVYLFGSRADDGQRLLEGEAVAREGSDLDVGLVFLDPDFDVWELSKLQALFEHLGDLEAVAADLRSAAERLTGDRS
jgi:predicted nucleotidyltransferase